MLASGMIVGADRTEIACSAPGGAARSLSTRSVAVVVEAHGVAAPRRPALAAELGLIDAETEKQADLARDFRNYIHPGRVKTKGKKCDEKTALLTRAAVLAVVEELKKQFPW